MVMRYDREGHIASRAPTSSVHGRMFAVARVAVARPIAGDFAFPARSRSTVAAPRVVASAARELSCAARLGGEVRRGVLLSRGRTRRATRVPAFLIDASPDLALAALAALPDALLAFTGAVTFSKSKRLHETAFDCPMDRVALASECPEKVPAELAGRGARGAPEWSHPATLAFAAARVAAVKGRGITADEVVAAAARNAARAFGDEDEDESTPTRDET